MNDDNIEQAVRSAGRAIRCHQRGIYCRAVMWEAISAVVTTESAETVFDSLSADEQQYLRDQYSDWPPSLWSCREPEEYARCAAIERWVSNGPTRKTV
jgi:hypothetical protein